jgi:hypothetical protein
MKLETEFDFKNVFLLMTWHPSRRVHPPIFGNYCCNRMMRLAVLQNVQPKYESVVFEKPTGMAASRL